MGMCDSLLSPFPIKPVRNPTHDCFGDSGVLDHFVGEHGVCKLSVTSGKPVVVFKDEQAYFVSSNCALSTT